MAGTNALAYGNRLLFKGRLLALLSNIMLQFKWFVLTNELAYDNRLLFKGRLLVLLANIRLQYKWFVLTNALAYDNSGQAPSLARK